MGARSPDAPASPLTLASGSSYQATCTTSSLAAGSHAVSAAYSGDPAYTPSAASLTQEVGPTTTSVTSSLNPSAYGQPVTFTATVSPGDGGGTVTFSAGGNPIPGCSSQPLTLTSGSSYQATCVTSSLAPGRRAIKAAYSGDTNYSNSSATITDTVNQQRTATILKSGTDPSTYGHAVTFTATVSPTNGQGTVSFTRGTGAHKITLCPHKDLSLVNGSYRATCTISSLPAATYPYTIVASYTGDTDYSRLLRHSAADREQDPHIHRRVLVDEPVGLQPPCHLHRSGQVSRRQRDSDVLVCREHDRRMHQ